MGPFRGGGECSRDRVRQELRATLGAKKLCAALLESAEVKDLTQTVEEFPGCASITKDGLLPLFVAVMQNHYRNEQNHSSLQLLLGQHPKTLTSEAAVDGKTRPFLHHALRQCTSEDLNASGELDMVKMLLGRGSKAIYTRECGTNYTPLHVAVLSCEDRIVIEVFEAWPGAVLEKDAEGKTPVDHILAEDEPSLHLLESFLRIVPMIASVPDELGRLLLHRILEHVESEDGSFKSGPLTDCITRLAQEFPESLLFNDYNGRIALDIAFENSVQNVESLQLIVPPMEHPLHFMCRNSCHPPLPLIRTTLASDSAVLSTRDVHGDLPLHALLRNDRHSCYESVNYMIRNYPEALEKTDGYAEFPLHVAVAKGWISDELIEEILQACPQSAGEKDQEGWLPWQRLAPTGSLDIIYEVLRNAPGTCVRTAESETHKALFMAYTGEEELDGDMSLV